MEAKEIVQAIFDAVQNGDTKFHRSLLAEDFQFSGPVPKALGADGWVEAVSAMRTAFPDLDYHFKVEGSIGDTVHATMQRTGTQTGPLDLHTMGMGVIPPTGKFFSSPVQHGHLTIRDGLVRSFIVDPVEGADLFDLLATLGVAMPTH